MLAEGMIMNKTNAHILISDIKSRSPLIWNISNFVSMDIAANMLFERKRMQLEHHLPKLWLTLFQEADAFAKV